MGVRSSVDTLRERIAETTCFSIRVARSARIAFSISAALFFSAIILSILAVIASATSLPRCFFRIDATFALVGIPSFLHVPFFVRHDLITTDFVTLQGQNGRHTRIGLHPIQDAEFPGAPLSQTAVLPVGHAGERAAGAIRHRTLSAPAPAFGFFGERSQSRNEGFAAIAHRSDGLSVAAASNLIRCVDLDAGKREAGGLSAKPSPGVVHGRRRRHLPDPRAQIFVPAILRKPSQFPWGPQAAGDVAHRTLYQPTFHPDRK